MQLVVSLTSTRDLEEAVAYGADLIELRLDLIHEPVEHALKAVKTKKRRPFIVTLRSRAEGGQFDGSPEEWFACISPWLEIAEFVDIERSFAHFAPRVAEKKKRIIASAHLQYMPNDEELKALCEELHSFGDLPKIVVIPSMKEDVLRLLRFTLHADGPLCTGVMGDSFRFARALLPLFGSQLVYCHIGTPAATGQYHIREMKTILEILK